MTSEATMCGEMSLNILHIVVKAHKTFYIAIMQEFVRDIEEIMCVFLFSVLSL